MPATRRTQLSPQSGRRHPVASATEAGACSRRVRGILRAVTLRDRLFRAEPALNLALLRIVVAAMMLLAPGFRAGVDVAGWDPVRLVAPEGLGWFVAHVPISVQAARVAQGVVLFCAVLGGLGVHARKAFAGLTLSAFYLFAIAQLTGVVWHDMHLLWFSAVLALSPCADVLAIDAKYDVTFEHERYAPPIVTVCLLFGAIYFFPGFRKLYVSGLDWVLSDNLANQLYWKWLQHGQIPDFRIDQIPGALKAGGAFVVLFELTFVALVFVRRARPWLAACGVAFHVLSEAIFKIPFASLWMCYVAFVDFRPVARRVRPLIEPLIRRVRRDEPADAGDDEVGAVSPSVNASLGYARTAMFAALIAGTVIQGARGQMQSYPFACYPTFEWRAASVMPDLGIVAVQSDGTERTVPHARSASGYRTQRQWAELWSLAGVYGSVSNQRLQAYVRSALSDPIAQQAVHRAVAIRVYRDALSVHPDDRGQPPRSRKRLLEIQLAPAATR